MRITGSDSLLSKLAQDNNNDNDDNNKRIFQQDNLSIFKNIIIIRVLLYESE